MRITIEGTPEEIADWARRVGGATTQPAYVPTPFVPLAPPWPSPTYPWGVSPFWYQVSPNTTDGLGTVTCTLDSLMLADIPIMTYPGRS